MADVSRDERGQLLLVTAIGLAVLFVVLALLLNTLIFTANFASRKGPVKSAGEAVDYRLEAERVVIELLRASEQKTGSFSTLNATFTSRVHNWSELSARQLGTSGAVTHVTPHATEGARVAQENESRPFTNASSDPSWTLVEETPGVRAWWLTVSRENLTARGAIENESEASDLVNASVFRTVISNGSATWRVFVYQDGTSDVLVRVEAPNGTLSAACRTAATNGTAVVGMTNATVGGGSCAPLAAITLGGDAFDIAYRGGNNATGTYSLVVNRTAANVDDGDLQSPGSGVPYVTGGIYAADIDVGYATPGLRYSATVHIAPGELR